MIDLFDRSRFNIGRKQREPKGYGDRFAKTEIPNDISALSAATMLWFFYFLSSFDYIFL